MTREQFESYLDAPEKIEPEIVSELKSMVDEFPFCQTTRLLYVTGLRNQKSISFDDQLNLMAAYSPDRKSLYYLINPVAVKNEPVEQAITAEPDDTNETISESKVESATVEEVEVALSTPFDLTKDEEPPLDEYELSENYLHELVGTSLSFDLQEKEEIREEKDKGSSSSIALEMESETDEKHDFSSWLTIFDDDSSEKMSQESIIDNFLKSEPKIKPQTKSNLPTTNLARNSALIHDEIITETLAKIHVEQGNISKAVEIYNKLSLKFPEKSSYFAAQIKFLKQKP